MKQSKEKCSCICHTKDDNKKEQEWCIYCRNNDAKKSQPKEMEDKNRKERIDYNEYNRVHYFIRKKLGKATGCIGAECDSVSNQFDWALRHGEDFWNINSYFELCRSCHTKYDETESSRMKKSDGLKKKMEVRSLDGLFVEVFNSMTDAKEYLETYNDAIYRCLATGLPISNGKINYIVKYV